MPKTELERARLAAELRERGDRGAPRDRSRERIPSTDEGPPEQRSIPRDRGPSAKERNAATTVVNLAARRGGNVVHLGTVPLAAGVPVLGVPVCGEGGGTQPARSFPGEVRGGTWGSSFLGTVAGRARRAGTTRRQRVTSGIARALAGRSRRPLRHWSGRTRWKR